MTVGELVRKTENGPMMTSYERALRDLGIWDAEVLEGEVYRVYGEPECPDEFWIGELGRSFSAKIADEGQRIRIIVLPQEEK